MDKTYAGMVIAVLAFVGLLALIISGAVSSQASFKETCEQAGGVTRFNGKHSVCFLKDGRNV